MEFRLTYDGRLPAASASNTRNTDKDRIRRSSSKQLAELFATHPLLKSFGNKDIDANAPDPEWTDRVKSFVKSGESYSAIDLTSVNYERCGKRYMPLITEKQALRVHSIFSFFDATSPATSSSVEATSIIESRPRGDGEHINDVRLIVHVKTIVVDSSNLTSHLWG